MMNRLARCWSRLMTINVNVHANGAFACADLDLLRTIGRKVDSIMSAISDFAAKQKTHNDKADAAVTGINSDFADLKNKIAELQASAGTITPEDQVLLDAIDARAEGISTKLEALDALTPPVIPPTP